MSSETISLPAFGTLEATLVETTEFLARQLSSPGHEPPRWSDLEWRVAQAVAALHGISGLLSATLLWTGPDEWQAFLREQKAQTLLRQQAVEQLLARIGSGACDAGIGIVALKGAEVLAIGLYPPGTRPMGDVDLLVDPRDIEAGTDLLTTLGYTLSFENWRHRVFVPRTRMPPVPFGEHVGNPLDIELHCRIVERLPVFETDITARTVARPLRAGLNAYASIAALMRHLLLHAAGNMRARALRLIQLHDIALLAARMRGADWKELLAPEGEATSWWTFPPLALTARYYPAAIPGWVTDAAQQRCPWLLRRAARRHGLCDVSWSKIRIQALPGIEWARSPLEAAVFAKRRIWPSRAELADLAQSTRANADAADIPWYGLSHGSRILRWTFSRPPRVQTMHSVRCVLGQRS